MNTPLRSLSVLALSLAWIHAGTAAETTPGTPKPETPPAAPAKPAVVKKARNTKPPYLAYAYPAGVRAGESVEITLGGGNIYGATAVLVSGDGVTATIVDSRDPEEGLDESQRKRKRLKTGQTQLDENVTVRLTVAPGAATGERDLAIVTPNGASNRRVIQIGRLPEVLEKEANNTAVSAQEIAALPATLNGRILQGDEDWFRFSAKRGQSLVVEMSARTLIPYIADAVPGWFQSTVALCDASGRELAYDDDYRFNPDPVLFFTVPADGEYKLRIRDALSRGREDFVYRVRLGELPFITGIEPLGARRSENPAPVRLRGKNLPTGSILPPKGDADIVALVVERNGIESNRVPFALGRLPEVAEDSLRAATQAASPKLTLPVVVNGAIARPGEKDRYTFHGEAGETVALEVVARRLGSPLDSKLTLLGPDGAVIAANDDRKDPTEGLLTHQADSAVTATLPVTGDYVVVVEDTQGGAGVDHRYRLRLDHPHPDFLLRVSPASAVIPPGGTVRVSATLVRQNGFTGPVRLAHASPGSPVVLSGEVIPAGVDKIALTLSVPESGRSATLAPKLVGIAEIEGETRRRAALAAEDNMQAFIYHHAVPCRDLLLSVPAEPPAFSVNLAPNAPTVLNRGGLTTIPLVISRKPDFDGEIRIQIAEALKGVSLTRGSLIPEGVYTAELVVRTEAGAPAGNLQLNAVMTLDPPEDAEPAKAGAKPQKIRISFPMPALRLDPAAPSAPATAPAKPAAPAKPRTP